MGYFFRDLQLIEARTPIILSGRKSRKDWNSKGKVLIRETHRKERKKKKKKIV